MSVRPLCHALAEKARQEWNEDPRRLEDNIRQLREWIVSQPHLRARTDDQWLAAFLRGCKFKLEQSKAKIDLYYSVRSTKLYQNSIKYFDPKVMEILNEGCTLMLQKTRNPADPRIIFYRLGSYDTKKICFLDILSVLALQNQICFMEDDNLVVAGTIHVMDFGGSRLAHFLQTSIRDYRHIIRANQEAVPMRIKSIHLLNPPTIFHTFFNIGKRFLNQKIKDRIIIHKNLESLYEHVPEEVLPEEYGGSGGSRQESIDFWKKKITDYSSFFEDDLKYGSDESRRPGKSHTEDSAKAFRKLEFD